MTRSVRAPFAIVVLATLGLIVGACTPASDSPATSPTPALTGEPSDRPGPTDATPGTSPTASTDASPGASPAGSATPTAGETDGSAGPGTSIVRAYFFLGSFTGNEGLAPVLREVPRTAAVATAAVTALLEGPSDAEMAGRPAMFTTIPDGTRLLGLSITDGVATVNLSREFESGGGTASILGRLAQVTFTLTQFPSVDGVVFQLEGEPVSVFGGEGVTLDHPVGRADYEDQLPAIFVDRPAWGAAIGNPARISGLANVFEGQFRVELLGENGEVIAEKPVTASCGTGCRGTFRLDVPYTVGKAQYGTLRVSDISEADGSVVDVTEYPVWLTPAG